MGGVEHDGIITGMNTKLATIDTLLIDGDGVLWYGNEPLPGLNRLFDVLDRRGINRALVTNNATRSVASYVDKLQGFGVATRPDQIFSSASVTAGVMQKRYPPGTALYVIGEPGLYDTLRGAGFSVYAGEEMPDADIPAVIVALDRSLTYGKLAVAALLIRNGAAFIATNPDRTLPTPKGLMPGAGSIVAAVMAVSDGEPEVIGKPESAIYEAVMEHFGSTPETSAMLGDRFETDIVGAQRVGMTSILVLSGITQREELLTCDHQPDIVLENIAELADEFEKLAP
jgi:4-nitrophenyl phosphatase